MVTAEAESTRRLTRDLPPSARVLAVPLVRGVELDVPWPVGELELASPRREWPWVLVSSPRAARVLVRRIEREPGWARLPWCALGEGTARELLALGFPGNLVAGAGDASSFADYVVANVSPDRALLVPHSDRADGVLLERLRRAGRKVLAWAAYTVVSRGLDRWPEPVDAVPRRLLLTAPSQVRAAAAAPLALPAECWTLGERTASALRLALADGLFGPRPEAVEIRSASSPSAAGVAALWASRDGRHPRAGNGERA